MSVVIDLIGQLNCEGEVLSLRHLISHFGAQHVVSVIPIVFHTERPVTFEVAAFGIYGILYFETDKRFCKRVRVFHLLTFTLFAL